MRPMIPGSSDPAEVGHLAGAERRSTFAADGAATEWEGCSSMPQQTLGEIVGLSLLAYGMMAVIAISTAVFIAGLVRALAAVGNRAAARSAAPAPAPAAVPKPTVVADGVDPSVIAVISAAINATIGQHTIVYIGESPNRGGWTGEARLFHHGSHHPHSP